MWQSLHGSPQTFLLMRFPGQTAKCLENVYAQLYSTHWWSLFCPFVPTVNSVAVNRSLAWVPGTGSFPVRFFFHSFPAYQYFQKPEKIPLLTSTNEISHFLWEVVCELDVLHSSVMHIDAVTRAQSNSSKSCSLLYYTHRVSTTWLILERFLVSRLISMHGWQALFSEWGTSESLFLYMLHIRGTSSWFACMYDILYNLLNRPDKCTDYYQYWRKSAQLPVGRLINTGYVTLKL